MPMDMKLTEIIKEIEQEVKEGGFSKIGRILRGLEVQVKTIAIITAENPCINKTSSASNKERNHQLEKELHSGHYGFRKVKGKYGNLEHPYMINNITKSDAIRIGTNYGQESIIYGEQLVENGDIFMKIELIKTNKCEKSDPKIGTVLSSRNVFIGKEGATDYYTSVKGRKFGIPFFDETDVDPKTGNKTITSYKDAKWDGGKVVGVQITEEDIKLFQNYLKKSLSESMTPKSRWMARGMMNNIIGKYIFQ